METQAGARKAQKQASPSPRSKAVTGWKRVKIGVTQMGVTVFEMTDVPVTNIIYETMNAFQPDKKERGVVINKKPKGTIYLKTADCKDICAEMTRNKEMLQASAAMKTSSSTENLPAAAAVRIPRPPPLPSTNRCESRR